MLGQNNLVINPSFEQYDTCPYSLDQVHFATPWNGFFTPDYFNACGGSVPYAVAGYQQAHTGNGYVGLAAYAYYYNGSCPDCREYIKGELIDTLKSNHRYCVEFYISLANCSFWAVNQMGIYFSSSPVVDDSMGDTLSYIPQIRMDTTVIMNDTMNWIKVSGVFVAGGGEKYLLLGNFYADNQTDTLSHLGSCIVAYYYIDDVAIYELQDCNAGSDFSICYKDSVQLGIASMPNVMYEWTPTEWLSDPNISNPTATPDTSITYVLKQTECDAVSYDTVRVIVNRDCHSASSILIPTVVLATQEFFISGLESNSRLDVYDMHGRLIYSCEDYLNDYRFMNDEQAIYITVLTRPNGERIVKKVLLLR